MSRVDLSVIVPIYNCEEYIELLFSSLLAQDNVSFEIIVVNDGSTDGSLVKLDEIGKSATNLIIISQENKGLSEARNTGIRHANGEWIAFVDGDDWLEKDTLSTWLGKAEEQRLDLLIGNGFKFNENPEQEIKEPIQTKQPWGEVISGNEWVIRGVKHNEWCHFVWLQLIRRDIISVNNLSFIPDMMHEDILWTASLALVAKRVGFCEKMNYGYRISNVNSETKSSSIEKITCRANSYIDIMQGLISLAAQNKDNVALNKALIRHANQESRHFFGLLRKKILSSAIRQQLSEKFISTGIGGNLFKGMRTFNDFWYSLRFYFTVYLYLKKK
ncbi:glycosyltransferase [Pectobacterium versatile]|uniref:glycosyltransferase n=1 Tax=Pectobacterium versatile TaxID=2488639 RepID=UPI001B3A7AF1|nr:MULTISPECIES: glycosyltransferase [Pectobacterium]MBQ4771069.1 glycosyltransferase [Pectobacterium versatile]MBQ4780530.1 glycosyltransferase [Pectobacterium versatile]MBQ4785007.1 glycosyltransferase [Pectobacterium versatile]MCL6335910.1 glycosyltransferase [Pectobacterium carotovorum subsp. carotovorum]MCL6348928.1 glycosyltransferase [Pectobacterium carotovorum subsp. carotovorum]